MPRSGSTLQYNIVRLLLEDGQAGVGEGYVAPDQTRTNYVATDQLAGWASDSTYHLVKTHPVHPALPELLAAEGSKVCYIYRDLRDVAVSRRIAWGDKTAALFEGLDRSVAWYWELSALRDSYPDAVLWQRYERVMGDLRAAVRETALFLGVSADETTVDSIAEACDVETVKPQVDKARGQLQELLQDLRKRDPRLAGKLLHRLGRGNERAETIFREDKTLLSYNQISPFKGAVGGWREHLDPALATQITERYADWYAEAYATDSRSPS